jgi:hypothetical protein
MKNWAVDEKKLKLYPEQHEIWYLEQLINYGLDGEKLERRKLLRYFGKLAIDPQKRKYLKFLLSR